MFVKSISNNHFFSIYSTSFYKNLSQVDRLDKINKIEYNPKESKIKKVGKKSSPAECKTCKERKYQDDSDEQVSFKSASHISPESSASKVRGHEQEHVTNAYKKAFENNGKVLNCSVSLKTAICPECGKSYVSGGTTSTQIKYTKEQEKNPYIENFKKQLEDVGKGQNINYKI